MAHTHLEQNAETEQPITGLRRLLCFSRTSGVAAIASLILALLLWLSPTTLQHEWLDGPADRYFEQTMTQAGLAYGTTRLINASVSVIMESNLQVQPAGVGLSLAVGQVLDPLNDMAERVSDVLVTAIVALGVQKLMYEICLLFVPAALLVVLLFILFCGFSHHPLLHSFRRLLLRLSLALLVLRLFLPLSSMLNGWIYQHFFEAQITTVKQALNDESENIQGLADFSKQQQLSTDANRAENSRFWSQWLENSVVLETADFLEQKSHQIKQAFLSKQQYAATIIEHLLTLTYLYVGLFVIQVLLLPLAMFYGLIKLGQVFILTTLPKA